MAITRSDFPLPDLGEPLTAPFFAAAARGELSIPHCRSCARAVWYPAPACPRCGSETIDWKVTSGRASLFSWAVVRRAFLPAFAEAVPLVAAIVTLDEDPEVRLVSRVVDCDPESLRAGLGLEAVFRPLAFPTVPGRSVVVPLFRPRDAGDEAGPDAGCDPGAPDARLGP